MRATPPGGLRLVQGGRRGPGHDGDWAERVFLALAGLALLVALVSGVSSTRHAVRTLPVDERRAVLGRTVDELRQLCGERMPIALAGHCRELATFAAQFDECRGECETLVRRQLTPGPAR